MKPLFNHDDFELGHRIALASAVRRTADWLNGYLA